MSPDRWPLAFFYALGLTLSLILWRGSRGRDRVALMMCIPFSAVCLAVCVLVPQHRRNLEAEVPEIPIAARKIKIAVPLDPAALPAVPLEGPIGDLQLRLTMEGSGLVISARLNGKSYRKMFKTVAEKGAANVTVILQGDLVARGSAEGPVSPMQLDSAGFQVLVRAPKESAEGRTDG